MGIGAQRTNLAAMLASSRVIALAAAPEHARVVAERERGPEAEEPGHDPVVAEPGHDPVAAQLGLARVVAELEHGLVVAKLERGPVAEPPVPNQPHAQLAVPPRTKSVIAVHHRGRVPLLAAVEDLAAAAAETMRDPAATEAGIAWVAAV
jgi:hypothetical protein